MSDNTAPKTPDDMRNELMRRIREQNQGYMNEIAMPGVNIPVENQTK